jgi:glycosyltransferase involved in cell wall biosynthesis
MRVAIIAEVFLPKVDGVVMRTMRLLEHLKEAGDEVVVFCPHAENCEHPTIPTVSFPSFSCVAYPEYRIGLPSVRLVNEIEEFSPDVIHFLNPFAFGFRCYDFLHRQRVAIPTVFSFHTLYGEFVKQYPVLRGLSHPLWRLTRTYHNRADVNLTVSSILRKDLEQRGFKRVRTWPPAVDTEWFHPQQKSEAMRRRLTSGEANRPLLLTVSRLAAEKNVGFLARVIKHFPNARLAIVGDGPDRARLERKFAGTGTTFTGYLRGRDLAQAYATADLFVYGSETETMGNVVMEAMSSGLPVVVPEAGGIPSLLKDGESGLLYRPGNVDAAVARVAKLLDDPVLRQSLGDHARDRVERCGWRSSVNEVRNTYREAIEQFELAPAEDSGTHWYSSMAVTSLVFAFRCGSWLRGDWGRQGSSLTTYPSNA